MKRLMVAVTAVLLSLPALAQETGSVQATAPTMDTHTIRLTPAIGPASFTVDDTPTTENFDGSFAAGLLLGIGEGPVTFETGLLTLQNDDIRDGGIVGNDIDQLAVPISAKWNFSGQANRTVYARVGGMPFWDPSAVDDLGDVDVMGVAAIGGAIPFSPRVALMLDAAYNRNLTSNQISNDFQGYTLLAGLQIGL